MQLKVIRFQHNFGIGCSLVHYKIPFANNPKVFQWNYVGLHILFGSYLLTALVGNHDER